MSKESNLESQQRFGDAVNSGNFGAFDELVAADSIDHDPAPKQGPGPQGFKDMFGELRTAFPDLKVEVVNLVQDEEQVAFAYTLTGTHDGPFMGHEPTGKSFSIRVVQISKIVDGKLVERWGSSDQLGMLTQLGLAS